MVTLDSRFVLDCVQGNPSATRQLLRLRGSLEPLYISTAARAAVIDSAAGQGQDFRARVAELLSSFECLALDSEAVRCASEIATELATTGQRLDGVELFTAASARQHGQAVLSRNPSFERVRGLIRMSY